MRGGPGPESESSRRTQTVFGVSCVPCAGSCVAVSWCPVFRCPVSRCAVTWCLVSWCGSSSVPCPGIPYLHVCPCPGVAVSQCGCVPVSRVPCPGVVVSLCGHVPVVAKSQCAVSRCPMSWCPCVQLWLCPRVAVSRCVAMFQWWPSPSVLCPGVPCLCVAVSRHVHVQVWLIETAVLLVPLLRCALILVSPCRSAASVPKMRLGLSIRSNRSEESEVFLEGQGNS